MTIADRSVQAFLGDVAAGGVTPGGGATAAVAGAAGAALLEMVCANTLEREGTEGRAEDLHELRAELADRREQLLSLADEDVAAVEALMEAYGTPADDGRQEAIQAASVQATEIPVEIAEACRDVLNRAPTVVDRGNPNAVADGVIGAYLAHGALEAMMYTVHVNLGAIDDETRARDFEARADAARSAGEAAFERLRDDSG